MRKAAERAKVWPAVRSAAFVYLETGKLPHKDASWPLPETGVEKAKEPARNEFPITAVLVDIAIAEKRADEVLRWYDYRKSKKDDFWTWHGYREDHIASAIAQQYPDRALTIWKGLAETQIAQAKPNAYETASGYLKKVRECLKKVKREVEWKDYLLKLRQANTRKSKLLQILDRLEGHPIIKT